MFLTNKKVVRNNWEHNSKEFTLLTLLFECELWTVGKKMKEKSRVKEMWLWSRVHKIQLAKTILIIIKRTNKEEEWDKGIITDWNGRKINIEKNLNGVLRAVGGCS